METQCSGMSEDIPMAAPTVVVKKEKEAMNVHLDDVDIDDGSGSNSGNEDVKHEDEDADTASINRYCKCCLFLNLMMLIISQNLLTPPTCLIILCSFQLTDYCTINALF